MLGQGQKAVILQGQGQKPVILLHTRAGEIADAMNRLLVLVIDC